MCVRAFVYEVQGKLKYKVSCRAGTKYDGSYHPLVFEI